MQLPPCSDEAYRKYVNSKPMKGVQETVDVMSCSHLLIAFPFYSIAFKRSVVIFILSVTLKAKRTQKHYFKGACGIMGSCTLRFTLDKGRKYTYEPRHEKTCLCHMRTTKVQISVRIRAVWSAHLLFASWIVWIPLLTIAEISRP